MQRLFLIGASILFIVLVVVGIWLAGSPQDARLKRFDDARIQDLNAISNAVTNFYNKKDKLPTTVVELDEQNQRDYNQTLNLKDPQSGVAYEYRVISTTTREFELCAQFNLENQSEAIMYYEPYGKGNTWQHSAGRDCFIHVADKY